MSIGGYAWRLRRRVLGPERVVTGDAVSVLAKQVALGRRGHARIRALHLRELAFGPPRHARIAVGGARVELGGYDTSFPVDWRAFVEVFAEEPYHADYKDAHVLDVGAHKGYFGAYALARGAHLVVSFEPEAENFGALERAAAPLHERWLVRNAAVSDRSGSGTLQLAPTSWAHSLAPLADAVGEQQVALVTLGQALAELAADGARTVVKIDAEGSECAILARPEPLAAVDYVLVEWHPEIAPCTAEHLAQSVMSAGFLALPPVDGVLRFARQE